MAKKKSQEPSEHSSVDANMAHELPPEAMTEAESAESSNEANHPLMEEVQSFLNLRDELARKLAAEIQMMEDKLAELKKTAAALFPNADADSASDRKAKKPKPKPTAPKEKSAPAASVSAESEQGSDE